MNTSAVGQAMPPWLHDVFLGYGDPAGAHYRSLSDKQVVKGLDFGDTLLDVHHVREVRENNFILFFVVFFASLWFYSTAVYCIVTVVYEMRRGDR